MSENASNSLFINGNIPFNFILNFCLFILVSQNNYKSSEHIKGLSLFWGQFFKVSLRKIGSKDVHWSHLPQE
jgi:hypothetical protein